MLGQQNMKPGVVDYHPVRNVNVCPHVEHAIRTLHIGKLGKLIEALKPVTGHAQVRCRPRTRSGEASKNVDIAAAALAAGEYRIKRVPDSLIPAFLRSERGASTEDYMKFRFGAQTGAWKDEVVESVIVREGQKTVLPPLRWATEPP